MSNQQAFLRFRELLETRQLSHDPDLDIREHVLSLKNQKAGFGYASHGLKTSFGANLPNLFPNAIAVDEAGIDSADFYVAFGTIFQQPDHSHKGGVKLFNAASPTAEVLFGEAGFLATTHSWSHSFKEHNPAYACLGYVYDDLAHYFMADYPNRLVRKLNSHADPSPEELNRAETLLQRIVMQRVSKYNAQPMQAPAMTEGYTRRVLVCDQAYADASTVYGKVGDAEFEKMLLAAIAENPDAEILVKTHPDTVWEKDKRTGYYTHLQSTGRVRMLRDPINPYVLFDLVDTVYVGTSQMGLEALFAGKKVVTFGAPFYAGWGLTDDRQKIPHRHRSRSLAEIFHYFYIWYTIYHLPGKKGVAEIEDVLSYIETKRPYQRPPTAAEIAAPPKVSVIIPVHGVEKYIEECINSIQIQTLKEVEIIPVNDVSPDNAQAVIDRLAAEDPRIRPIVLEQNVKQGMARNKGFEAARGKYVWLLDGDDWLSNTDMLRELFELAEADGLDMVRARKAFEAVFDENDVLLQERQDGSEKYFTEAVRKTSFAEAPHLLHNRHCWTWLYRRDFLTQNDIRFITPQWEERAFLLRALVKAKAIGLSAMNGPAYRIRTDSTARRERDSTDFEMMLKNFDSTFGSLAEEGAAERGNPLRHHLNFQLSQFLQHMLVAGPYSYYREQGEEAELAFLSRLREQFLRFDFQPDDFVTDMHKLSAMRLAASAYPLMVAAVVTGRWDILRLSVDLAPIPQDKLYQILLAEPTDVATRGLQTSLSIYARNHRAQPVTEPQPDSDHPKPRIVIHIGSTKTGSTFLQHFLEKNRPELLRQGIWFPEVGLFWQPSRPHKQAGHSQFNRAALKDDPKLRDHIRRGLELMDGRIHTIVLSSEAFFLNENSPLLADYFAGHPVEMVVYLRRQDEWANSQYCEFVAGGAVGRVKVPIDEWLTLPKTEQWLDYRVPLTAWSEKIGQENVHVRVYDRGEFVDGDLLADFAQATGLPQLLDMPRPVELQQNDARLSAGHVELLRRFNGRRFQSRDSYFNFIEEAGSRLTEWRKERGLPLPKPWVLTEQQADALMQHVELANAAIAKEYLGRDRDLFGPRAAIPEAVPIFEEEEDLVRKIYRRYRRKPKVIVEPVAPPPKEVPAAIERPAPRIVNYGVLGWRLWLLTPILGAVYARFATPERLDEFKSEPFEFSRRHWARRRPLVARLVYPGGNSMGPFGIFRLAVPVARGLIGVTGRPEMQKKFDRDPILFARNMRSPWRRAVGRVFFPIGEKF